MSFWLGPAGARLTRSGVQQAFRRVLKRAGLTGPKLGPHCLRHTFGTEYVRSGGNPRMLQDILGHKNLETTMVYVQLAGEAVAQDHALHSPFKLLMNPFRPA